MAFKMKGSPMNRNFGIGDPDKKAERKAKGKRRREVLGKIVKEGPQDILEFGKELGQAVWGSRKTLPQDLAQYYVRDMPKGILELGRDIGTGVKEGVQKRVKKVVSKVKGRKKKSK